MQQVRKGCRIARKLKELGVRPYGVVRIDSAASPAEWAKDPAGNTRLIAKTFSDACDVAESFGERLAAEGEICWGGMRDKLAADGASCWNWLDRSKDTFGFQADMAHTLLFTLGYNAAEDRILPADFQWEQTDRLEAALAQLTAALRPWTIDFHVAQNDGTVKGSGSHDKTGHHCRPHDPNGKLNIVRDAGHWMRDERGQPTKAFQHICWDGDAMRFPNADDDGNTGNLERVILAVMLAVRDAHGWSRGVTRRIR